MLAATPPASTSGTSATLEFGGQEATVRLAARVHDEVVEEPTDLSDGSDGELSDDGTHDGDYMLDGNHDAVAPPPPASTASSAAAAADTSVRFCRASTGRRRL